MRPCPSVSSNGTTRYGTRTMAFIQKQPIRPDASGRRKSTAGGSGSDCILHGSALLLELGLRAAVAQAALSISRWPEMAVLHERPAAGLEPLYRLPELR